MRFHRLPTGAWINLRDVAEVTPWGGDVCLVTGRVEKPGCVIVLTNGSRHFIRTETMDEARAMAVGLVKMASRA